MVDLLSNLKNEICKGLNSLYDTEVNPSELVLSETKKEFDGHYTLVVFPFTKAARQRPEDIGNQLGEWLVKNCPEVVSDFNVIKGFLNIVIQSSFWISVLQTIISRKNLGIDSDSNGTVLVEFSSPNTNKPLHLGHIRNILLGWSTAKILDVVGYDVIRTKIINDRGIAICKSMLAWQLYGDGETPDSTNMKGDHFVGRYYVEFDKRLSEEYNKWQNSHEGQLLFDQQKKTGQSQEEFFKTYKNEYFNENSLLGQQAKEMLLAWENEDQEVRDLWAMMNGWVYDGFDITYDSLGVSFDSREYESKTYLLGKDIIAKGLNNGSFYKKEDGSVWVDLESSGLDQKILLRSDGTSVYITQDLGTARMRYDQSGAEKMIYVVGDEQDYHFQVLFETLKKLGEPYADGLFHLSYGMVDLPTGRMKSREGTVVDADVLIAEVINEVKSSAIERGELEDLTEGERETIYRQIALGALKFFILKVNPQKRMVFNPKESVDIQGQTGPYIQNAFVRIKSIQRKREDQGELNFSNYTQPDASEIDLIQVLMNYPNEVGKAAKEYDPSVLANYAYDLARKFHKFYHDVRILGAENEDARAFRIVLSSQVAKTLYHCMDLLGIEMPQRM